MKTRWVSSSVILIALIAGSLPANAQQSQERIITRLPQQNEPLAITEVKVNGGRVVLDKKFFAGDDWMRSLVISVKNTSDKRILLASLTLLFPRPPGKDLRSVFYIFHGNWELQDRSPKPDERLVGIAPGDTVDIGFSVQRFVGLQQFLSANGYTQGIVKLDLMIGRVIFEDDTMWSGGEFRRDSKDPALWINSQSSGSQPR